MEQQQNRRPRRSSQEITALLEKFEGSGCSAKEFCKIQSISEGVFYKWKARYKKKKGKAPKTGSFAPVHILASPSLGGERGLFAEVNGIRIYHPVSASFLKELLA